jgi:hypothetical protein
MAERVGSLQEELAVANTIIAALHKDKSVEMRKQAGSNIALWLLLIFPTSGVSATAFYPVYKWMTSPNTVSHCYTDVECRTDLINGNQVHTCGFALIGHVDWHSDRRYGLFVTLKEAISEAAVAGCQVK